MDSNIRNPYLVVLGENFSDAAETAFIERAWDVTRDLRDYAPQAVIVNSDYDDAATIRSITTIRQGPWDVPIYVIAGANQRLMEFAQAGAETILPRGTPPAYIAASIIGAALRQSIHNEYTNIWCTQLRGYAFIFHPKSRTYSSFRLEFGPKSAQRKLTDKEVALLEFLAVHEGAPVLRQAILDKVWIYAHNANSHTVETHVYRLRQKINGDRPSALASRDTSLPAVAESIGGKIIENTGNGYALKGKLTLHKTTGQRVDIETIANILDQAREAPYQFMDNAVSVVSGAAKITTLMRPQTVRTATPSEALNFRRTVERRLGLGES